MKLSDLIRLIPAWYDLGYRYVRGECTPEEEFAVRLLLYILVLILGVLLAGPIQYTLARLYVPESQKDHWFWGRVKRAQRFTGTAFFRL